MKRKKLLLAVRILLGLIFFVFGLNGFFVFITPPEHTPTSGAFIDLLIATGFMYVEKTLEVFGGFLLLVNRYVPLALTLLGPIVVSILLFHLLMERRTLVIGIIPALLWASLMWEYRSYFYTLFTRVSHLP